MNGEELQETNGAREDAEIRDEGNRYGEGDVQAGEPDGASETEGDEERTLVLERERIARLERELQYKCEEAEGYLRHLQRLQADFENFRKRTRAEREMLVDSVAEDIFRKLLPVVDSLELAMSSAAGANSVDAIRQGVELTFRQLLDILQKEGVEPIQAVGEVFDPEMHEAVASTIDEDVKEEKVVEQFRTGYLFKGRVLRPAMVSVATPPHESSAPREAERLNADFCTDESDEGVETRGDE